MRDLREVAIAVVVIDERRDGFELIGMAVGAKASLAFSAPDIVKVPLQVAQHHQIQKAVVVQIHPRGAGGPAAAGDTSSLRHVGKRAVAVVVVERITPIRGHV